MTAIDFVLVVPQRRPRRHCFDGEDATEQARELLVGVLREVGSAEIFPVGARVHRALSIERISDVWTVDQGAAVVAADSLGAAVADAVWLVLRRA